MAPIELDISRERVIPSDKVESTYFRGNIVLEVGEMRLDTELIVDQHFATDSIMEDNAQYNPTDMARALGILTQGEPQDYAFNPTYDQAIRLLDRSGPITGSSELLETKPLSEDQIHKLEHLLVSDRAFKNIHGFKEWLLRFRGKKRKGYLPLHRTCDFQNRGISKVTSNNICLGTTMGVEGFMKMGFSYVKSTFGISRDWLTGVVDGEAVSNFINYWERKPPEERALDFLNQINNITKGKVVLSE